MQAGPQGRIVALHVNPGHRESMQPVATASFVAGEGIEGDRHMTPEENRQGYQVLLIDQETLDVIGLDAGAVRENVTTSGVDIASLEPGQRVALGDSAVVEVSKDCAPCSRMDELRPGLQEALEDRRGKLARVVHSGRVSAGAMVSLIETADTP